VTINGKPVDDVEEFAKSIVLGRMGTRGTVTNLGSPREQGLRIDDVDGQQVSERC
jgi:hypothetical protein